MCSSPTLPNNRENIQSLKKQIKRLDDAKKGLSKQVGQAKQRGENCAELVAKVGQLSKQIKSIKVQLKALNENSAQASNQHSHNGRLPVSASQFTVRQVKKTLPARVVPLVEELVNHWESYVQEHPQSTAYHSLKTLEAIRISFGHQPLYLIALDYNDQPCGILPIIRQKSRLFGDNWSSIPFFNYGGALGDNADIEEQLMAKASEIVSQSGGRHIEFRDCLPRPNLPCKNDKVSMLLTLPETPEQLWQAIGTKIRAQIKKAQTHDLRVKTGRHELVESFYTVFARNMRDLGTPVYSKQFFINILNQHTTANITVLNQGEYPIAAGFTLGWRNTLEIPWASTIREANEMNANMLLYWEILQFAITSGYQVFDFGRSSVDASTYKFKKQWGAQPHQLYWHYWLSEGAQMPEVNPNNPKYKLLISTWKRLPVSLTKWIGPPVVKYLP